MKHRTARKSDIQKETVLVTTLGTSPSVFTSTIWGLAHHENLLPHRIKVLTTRIGRERLIQHVFTPSSDFGGHTAWDSLCKDLENDGFDLRGRLEFASSPNFLQVFTAVQPGERMPQELDDITSQTENEQVADSMLETLRSVMNDDTRIVASIAGGRKTVSALFYACVSLIGRSDDRIIHVIVNEPFDRTDLKPPFYFPTQKCGRLIGRDGRVTRARDAKVSVIEVPFVPLANLFTRERGRAPGRFSALVGKYREVGQRQLLSALRVIVHRNKLEIEVCDTPVALAPREQLLTIFLAEHLLAGRPTFAGAQELAEAVEQWRPQFAATRPTNDLSDWRSKINNAPLDEQDIRRALSSLRKKLRDAGPPVAILASALPKRGRFSLGVSKAQLRLTD